MPCVRLRYSWIYHRGASGVHTSKLEWHPLSVARRQCLLHYSFPIQLHCHFDSSALTVLLPSPLCCSNLAAAGTRAEFRLGRTLGAFQTMLESGMELARAQGTGHYDARQSGGGAGTSLSFEECFAVCGGRQAEEELLHMSNECR